MRWTIQQYSMENPLILAYDNKPLLYVDLDGKDDAIHSKAHKILIQLVEKLNEHNVTIDLSTQVTTVWKDGTYTTWSATDAHHAAQDPDWLVNINES